MGVSRDLGVILKQAVLAESALGCPTVRPGMQPSDQLLPSASPGASEKGKVMGSIPEPVKQSHWGGRGSSNLISQALRVTLTHGS